MQQQEYLTADKPEMDIINDVLWKVTDTTSYRYEKYATVYGKDSMNDKDPATEKLIAVYPKMDNIYEWETNITAALGEQSSSLKRNSFIKIQELLSNSHTDTLQKQLVINGLSATPGYKLVEYTDKKVRRIPGTISRMRFSRILYDDKSGVGVLVVTTADNIKSGKVKVVFLERVAGKWDIVAAPVAEIW
ncbi:MAG: hypothetical protein HYU70_00420 [Bacteroidetes bacterium]|nr:hypothetical protein [Bacteroidota bacterium]